MNYGFHPMYVPAAVAVSHTYSLMSKKALKVSPGVLKPGNHLTPSSSTKRAPACCMSAPCVQYCEALRDPWSATSPWVPQFPSLPSACRTISGRGTASTGVNGFGILALRPQQTLFRDQNCVLYSTAANTLTGASLFMIGTGVTVSTPNSESVSTDFSGANPLGGRARLVACGIRLQYTGTVLNEGGTVSIGFMPTDGSVYNDSDVTLDSFANANFVALTRMREGVYSATWSPTDMDDFDYDTYDDLRANYSLAAVFQAPSTTACSFRYEFIAHWEVYISANLSVGLPSINATAERNATRVRPIDPMGAEQVLAAKQLERYSAAPSPTIPAPSQFATAMAEIQAAATQMVDYGRAGVAYATELGQFGGAAVRGVRQVVNLAGALGAGLHPRGRHQRLMIEEL